VPPVAFTVALPAPPLQFALIVLYVAASALGWVSVTWQLVLQPLLSVTNTL
jgi:hypothetical protein